MTLYFDTAYIAKCYLNEPDGKRVRKLAQSASGLTSSVWSVVELSCVFHRHVREGSLTARQALTQFEFFQSDLQRGVWNLLPVAEGILLWSAEKAIRLPSTIFLRSGDAVHLASARDAGFTEIWTNDQHLLAAAPHFGLTGKSV